MFVVARCGKERTPSGVQCPIATSRHFTPKGVSMRVVRCLQTFNHYVVEAQTSVCGT